LRHFLSVVLTAGLLAGGCSSPPPPQSRAAAGAIAACRSRTDQVFAQQNRYLLSERDTRDSPFSTSGNTGITTTGLSSRYARDNLYDNCVGSNVPDSGSAPTFSPGNNPSGMPSQP
jgi:hypothetical protein